MNRINKRTNMFFLILLLVHLGASIVLSALLLGPVKIGIAMELIITVAIVIVPACLFFIVFKYNISEWISFKRIKLRTIILIVIFTILIIPFVATINVASQLFTSNAVMERATDFLSAPSIVIVLLVGVLAPFGEEIAFRGVIFGGFRKSGMIMVAAMLSALYFGLAHMNFNQFCYATVLGLVFCLLNEATGSIWSSVIAHAVVNSLNVLMLFAEEKALQYSGSGIDDVVSNAEEITTPEYLIPIIIVLGGVAILFLAVAIIVFYGICLSEGRVAHIKAVFLGRTSEEDDMKDEKPNRRLLTVSGIIAIALCLFVMFGLDPLMNKITNAKTESFNEADYSKYVVGIKIDDGMNTTSGTGFVVMSDESDVYICTNAHILKNEYPGDIIFYNNEECGYNKVFVDETRDIALARVDKSIISEEVREVLHDALLLYPDNEYDSDTFINDRFHMIDADAKVKDGIGLGIKQVDEWPQPILETTIDIQPGTSGSPIFNEDGYVVGIAMAKWSVPGYDERYFAVSSLDIAKSIAEYCGIYLIDMDK